LDFVVITGRFPHFAKIPTLKRPCRKIMAINPCSIVEYEVEYQVQQIPFDSNVGQKPGVS
jgi:hypothetical protein